MTTLPVRPTKDYVAASSDSHRKVIRLQGFAQYSEWSRDMKHNITTENAWGIVLGSSVRPNKPQFNPVPTTDVQLKKLRPELSGASLSDLNLILLGYNHQYDQWKQWEAKNNRARGLILSSIVPEIETLVTGEETAKGMWDRLQAEFSKPDAKIIHGRWFSLMQAQLNVQKTSLTEYYTNLKHAAAEVNEVSDPGVSDSQLTFSLMEYGDYHGRQNIVTEFKRMAKMSSPENLFEALNASFSTVNTIQTQKPTASNYYFLHKPASTDNVAHVNTLHAGNKNKRRRSDQPDSHQNSHQNPNKRQATGASNPQYGEKTKASLVKCEDCGMKHRKSDNGPCFYIQPDEAPDFWDKKRAEKKLRALRKER
jgi:gag-polypeptide of LTR copia-type